MKKYRLFSVLTIFVAILFISLWLSRSDSTQLGMKMNSEKLVVQPDIVEQSFEGKVTLIEFFAGH